LHYEGASDGRIQREYQPSSNQPPGTAVVTVVITRVLQQATRQRSFLDSWILLDILLIAFLKEQFELALIDLPCLCNTLCTE
jgi:hypothetical protein